MTHQFHPRQWWLGAVRARAEKWAEAVFARTRGATPWPELGGAVALHARKVVVDVLTMSEEGQEQVRAAYDLARDHYEALRRGEKKST